MRFGDGFEANDFAARWDTHVDRGTTSAWGRTGATAATGAFSIADSPGGQLREQQQVLRGHADARELGGLHGCVLSFNARIALGSGDVFTVDRSLDGGGTSRAC